MLLSCACCLARLLAVLGLARLGLQFQQHSASRGRAKQTINNLAQHSTARHSTAQRSVELILYNSLFEFTTVSCHTQLHHLQPSTSTPDRNTHTFAVLIVASATSTIFYSYTPRSVREHHRHHLDSSAPTKNSADYQQTATHLIHITHAPALGRSEPGHGRSC